MFFTQLIRDIEKIRCPQERYYFLSDVIKNYAHLAFALARDESTVSSLSIIEEELTTLREIRDSLESLF